MLERNEMKVSGTATKPEFMLRREYPNFGRPPEIDTIKAKMKTEGAEKFNLASESYQEFKFSEKETSELIKTNAELDKITQEINKLGKQQEELLAAQKKLLMPEDATLHNILTEAFPTYKDKITCVVLREQSLCQVTIITNADDKNMDFISKMMFEPFIKGKYKTLSDTYSRSFLGTNKMHVFFQLGYRDELVKGLEKKLNPACVVGCFSLSQKA